MLFREISRFLGRYFIYFLLILIIPFALAIFDEFFWAPALTPHGTIGFAATIGVSLILASVCLYFGKHATGHFHRQESILIVALIWLLTPAVSSLPFIFSKTLENPVDAYFEAMSGLTTTGSTIMHAKS